MSASARPPRPGGTIPPTKRCPICNKPASEDARPFCSKRCADLDLHRWLGGHYAIPVVEEDSGTGMDSDED
ncbi:DNA gyrase inhibitor YacG [Acuticoccus sp. MNP-M23]|uniref:DNA gyrase inhibitor YacG n=1 Tax=Acuticoccus sp. MNP-M23 TaxID=3072793 RepID=UPI0028165886|nr:DNA gyrase inhibitor YacG [Acuticoccus sp. MNP-M23]WMS44228.1 DNA gyrase inhibitor YacG [Acuticoccus sp. MNP-M23]